MHPGLKVGPVRKKADAVLLWKQGAAQVPGATCRRCPRLCSGCSLPAIFPVPLHSCKSSATSQGSSDCSLGNPSTSPPPSGQRQLFLHGASSPVTGLAPWSLSPPSWLPSPYLSVPWAMLLAFFKRLDERFQVEVHLNDHLLQPCPFCRRGNGHSG